MKKIFILIVIVFLSLTFIQAKADCPTGYTEYSYNTTYTYEYPSGGGTFTCHVTVIYCCKWDNVNKEVITEITEIRPQTSGNNCLAYIPDIDVFLSWIHDETAQNADNSCKPQYPDCDDDTDPYYIFKVNMARCWFYKNYKMYVGDDVYSTVLRKCELGFKCVSKWQICLDYNYSPPELRLTFISKTPQGTPTCSTTVPTLPPAGKTWEEYWETGCFSTECN
jgi:hypothetical protein